MKTSRREAAVELLQRKRARRHLLAYMRYVWWSSGEFKLGMHTKGVCSRLTQAIDAFFEGESTFLVLQVPFRHGKSDMVSRALPGFFIGRCIERGGIDPDVIMTGYGAELVQSFSRRAKAIIRSPRYQVLFPHVQIGRFKDAANKWGLEGYAGEVIATGLGGALTGHGGHLLILDDYCKKREEAESEPYRRQVWHAFRDDLMTRRAPVSLVIVCATRWHTDDVVARIENEMKENEEFPQFEIINYPARSDDYPSGYLFPQRFDEQWYKTQYATLGTYSAAALLDGNPVVPGGNLLKTDGIQLFDSLDELPKGLQELRYWDLASTEKERIKDDPDFTVGTRLGLSKDEEGLEHIWIMDMRYCQEDAPKRDEIIEDTVLGDGSGIVQHVEVVGGFRDTYTRLRRRFWGKAMVKMDIVKNDKVVRAACVEPIFEAGNVHMLRASWNEFALKQLREFPMGAHDDVVDTISGGYTRLHRRLTDSAQRKPQVQSWEY